MVLNNYPRNFRNLSFSLFYFIPCLLARFFKILIWRFHQIAHSSSPISMAQTFIRKSYDLKFIFRIGKILESRVVIQLISVISLSLSFAIIGQYSAIVDARIVEGVVRTTGLGIYTRANDTLYPPRPRESLTTRVSAWFLDPGQSHRSLRSYGGVSYRGDWHWTTGEPTLWFTLPPVYTIL